MKKIRRAIAEKLNQKQDIITGQRMFAYLGDGAGVVLVPGKADVVWARIAGESLVQVCNTRAPNWHDLPVWIGYDPVEPSLLQVLGVIGAATSVAGISTNGAGAAPANRYRWMAADGGQDPLFVEMRQLLPLRISPAGQLKISVYPTILHASGGWTQVGGATAIDLATDVPTTTGKACFVLVTVAEDGTIVTTKGSEVNLADLGLDDIPAEPDGTRLILGMVRLYEGQTVIQEARSSTDIGDLRWAGWSAGGDSGASALDDLSDVTITTPSSGEALVYNGTAWVNDTVAGAGDMTKAVYDADDDGVVDEAAAVEGVETAGNSKYYGTNSGGTAGFYDLPEGGTGGGVDILAVQVFS